MAKRSRYSRTHCEWRLLLPLQLAVMIIPPRPITACLAACLLVACAAAKPPRRCSVLSKGNVDCSFRDFVTFPCPLPNDTQVLWLNHNKLRSIPAAALHNLRNITTLHLQNNQLTHVDQDVFDALPQLKELIAYNNPWNCSCNQIGPLSQWLRRNTLSAGTITCNEFKSPLVKNVAWLHLPKCASVHGNATQAPPFECKTPASRPHLPVTSRAESPVQPRRDTGDPASSGAAADSWSRTAVPILAWAALLGALSL